MTLTPLVMFAGYGVIVFVAIYLFVYVPSKKKQKKMQGLHQSLTPGDEVITIGGLVGVIREIEGDYVTLVLDETTGTTAKVVLYAISQIRRKSSAAE